MNLATLFPALDKDGGQLLQQASCIMDQLPTPTEGSEMCLAFGTDREAMAAALLATWLKGHRAAIVENSLRERIMPVLERPSVMMLLHDTDSARELQIPRLLKGSLPPTSIEWPDLDTDPLLTIHAQTEDGQQHWCSWNASELAIAIDDLGTQLSEHPCQPERNGLTPSLMASLFANTLLPWRTTAQSNALRPIDARSLSINGAPRTTTIHRAKIDTLLTQEGITDAAVITTPNHQALTALAGPGANALANSDKYYQAFEQIPRDPNEQPDAAAIFLAFGMSRTGESVTRQLQWSETSRDGHSVSLRTTVPSNYLFYEGHFANYPVMAGGVQLHEIVMPCLTQLHGCLPAVQKIDALKFLARIAPGDTIDLMMTHAEDLTKVAFEIQKEGRRCTTGRLQFVSAIEQSPFAADF
jgi:hypothetical protein